MLQGYKSFNYSLLRILNNNNLWLIDFFINIILFLGLIELNIKIIYESKLIFLLFAIINFLPHSLDALNLKGPGVPYVGFRDYRQAAVNAFYFKKI